MSRLMILDGLDAHPSGKCEKGAGKSAKALQRKFASALKACERKGWKKRGFKSVADCVGGQISGRKSGKRRGKRK